MTLVERLRAHADVLEHLGPIGYEKTLRGAADRIEALELALNEGATGDWCCCCGLRVAVTEGECAQCWETAKDARWLTDYERFLLGSQSIEELVSRARDAEARSRCEHGQAQCSTCDVRDLRVPNKPFTAFSPPVTEGAAKPADWCCPDCDLPYDSKCAHCGQTIEEGSK